MISSIIDMHTHALPMRIARYQEHYSRMDRILSLPFYNGSECNVEQLVRQMDEVGVEKAVILNWGFTRELERAIKDLEIKQKIQTSKFIYLGPSSARMFLYPVRRNVKYP